MDSESEWQESLHTIESSSTRVLLRASSRAQGCVPVSAGAGVGEDESGDAVGSSAVGLQSAGHDGCRSVPSAVAMQAIFCV